MFGLGRDMQRDVLSTAFPSGILWRDIYLQHADEDRFVPEIFRFIFAKEPDSSSSWDGVPQVTGPLNSHHC